MKKAKKDPEISLSSSHLIRHESSHGPADLMVLVGFSFRSKQNKQEPGQGKHSEREERALAQRAPKEIPGSSQPRARLERGHVGSPTPVMNLTFIRTDRKSSFWANFPYSWPVGLKATAGKGETKARRCGCEKRACSHWPCSLGTPNRCMQFDVFLGFLVFFPVKTLCSSFGPGWDGNFRHAREEDSRGQADKCHDGLAKEIQLSYEHVGRFSPSGNFLHEVQLRLGTTSDFQAVTPKAKPTALCSTLCSQGCKSKSGPKGVRKPRVSHLAEIHCAGLMAHPIFSFCSGGRRMRGECLGWWDKERHSGGGTKSNWDASPLPGQV